MKIEIDENAAVVSITTIVALTICCMALYGCHQVQQTENEAIKAGLEQQILPGSASPRWVKPVK